MGAGNRSDLLKLLVVGPLGNFRRHRDEMKTIMAKIFGALIVIGSIASFLGAKIAHWLKIDTTP